MQPKHASLGIPIAIVIAAALIAFAIYMSGAPSRNTSQNIENDPADAAPVGEVAPVTEADHIRGNPNAPILLVEYSDYDCPFCKQFHETMNMIMTDYGESGKVAWVYRHFPLESLHPNAPKLAEAGECVAELGGNDSFWTFTDLVFGERDTNEQTDMNRLPDFAETAGVDPEAFSTCLESGKYADEIDADIQAAIAAGGNGTPHTIVLVGGQQGVINGAQPYPVVKQKIENLLAQIEGRAAEAE